MNNMKPVVTLIIKMMIIALLLLIGTILSIGLYRFTFATLGWNMFVCLGIAMTIMMIFSYLIMIVIAIKVKPNPEAEKIRAERKAKKAEKSK